MSHMKLIFNKKHAKVNRIYPESISRNYRLFTEMKAHTDEYKIKPKL